MWQNNEEQRSFLIGMGSMFLICTIWHLSYMEKMQQETIQAIRAIRSEAVVLGYAEYKTDTKGIASFTWKTPNK